MFGRIKNFFNFQFYSKDKEKNIQINGETYTIRKIRTRDIRQLLAIEREVYFGEVPWDATAFFSELHSPFSHCYLLILHGVESVGFVGSRVEKGDCHITNIAVLPRYQNRGLGSKLMDEIRAYARKKKCQSLSLEVRIGNKDAQRLYRSMGFVSRAVKRNYYQDNREDALDMFCLLQEKNEN